MRGQAACNLPVACAPAETPDTNLKNNTVTETIIALISEALARGMGAVSCGSLSPWKLAAVNLQATQTAHDRSLGHGHRAIRVMMQVGDSAAAGRLRPARAPVPLGQAAGVILVAAAAAGHPDSAPSPGGAAAAELRDAAGGSSPRRRLGGFDSESHSPI